MVCFYYLLNTTKKVYPTFDSDFPKGQIKPKADWRAVDSPKQTKE